MFELRSVKMEFHGRTVLNIDALRLAQGKTLALAGANGSGKTTLLRILAGILKPTEGAVRTAAPILYLPQRCYPFRGTVLDNMLLGAKGKEKDALQLLEKVELAGLRNKKAASLSGGELQRLAFCRLLMRPCKLLLLDEPTSSCDAAGTRLLLKMLDTYRAQTGCTVVLSTHAPAVALQAAERLVILNNGTPETDGTPESVFHAPGSDWTKEFISEWRI